MSNDNIVDASRPSAGRIYDYLLGGSHNFEVDRTAADQMIKYLPFLPNFARLQRWALQDIAIELTERRGFDVIIDFASGLPTNDHIHLKVPKGTTVIYSDIDPIVVEYTHDILKDSPDVHFFQSNATRPEDLLNLPEVIKILHGRRKVAFIYWGLSAVISDDAVSHAMSYLYEWAAPGSCLAFNAQGADIPPSPERDQVNAIYASMGTTTYNRTLQEYRELVKPWQLSKEGFISLLEWHGFEESVFAKQGVAAFGPMGGGYGAYLNK